MTITQVTSVHPTLVGIPASRARSRHTDNRPAPWTATPGLFPSGLAAATTHIPELGAWVAVLDLVDTGLDKITDLDGLAAAGVAVDLLDRRDMAAAERRGPGARLVGTALGRILLRQLLTDRIDLTVMPEHWRFTTTASGRLTLTGPHSRPGLAISRGKGVVVAAVAPRPVGADVEAEPPADALDELLAFPTETAGRAEQAWLAGLPPALVRSGLARLWTLKRASTQAIGVEAAMDLGLLSARLDPPSVRLDIDRSRKSILRASQWPVTVGGERQWVAIVELEPSA